ncbi:MAG: amidase [Rhizobacter sp.]|nr:amidase [Rhizobacter sp.]
MNAPLNDIEHTLTHGSIADIGALLRERKASTLDIVQWYLARIDAHNKQGARLNAVREVARSALAEARLRDEELARGHDRGPLHGIPFLLKDSMLTADGMAACAGASALAGFVPRHEATLSQRLRNAGAVLLGKTNMTEFADYVSDVMPTEFSGAGGVVRNPHGIRWDRGQGSSVGSATAVAAGFAPFAIGSETQNSIQGPASHGSVLGYKPTTGLVSRAGIVPLAPSQDSPGPFARNVEDAALVTALMAGPDARDTATLCVAPAFGRGWQLESLQGVRIGVPRRAMAARPEFEPLMGCFESVIARLSAAGARIVDPCDLPSAEQLAEVRSSVFRTEFKAALDAFLADQGAGVAIGSFDALIAWNEGHPQAIPYGQSLLIAAAETSGLQDTAYLRDRARDLALSRDAGIAAALSGHDVDVLLAPMAAASKCTGKAGAPAVSIPAGLDASGAPFGVTLFASPGHDRRLLSVAGAVEQVLQGRVVPRLSA